MQSIRIRKGYGLQAAGKPLLTLQQRDPPETVAFVPKSIPFIKPRLAVRETDAVKVGSLLFSDKHRPELKFRSPGAGKVETIRFGARRVLEAVVIRLQEEEAHERFEPVTGAALETMEKADLIARIQEGGVWPLIRALPFRNIPSGHREPAGIIVSMGTREPFEPDASVYLSGQEALFQFGIRVLQRLATHVAVILPSGYGAPAFLKAMATHGVTGNYPCGDPGVFVYRTKTHPNQNGSWYIRGQDVLLLARLLREGRYPTERTVVSAGPEAGHPCHVATRMGAPLSHIVQPFDSTGARRFIVGGLFTGYPESVEGHLGFQETAVAVLSGEDSPEMWALFKPGYHKPSYTRAFLSRLNARPLYVDSRYHGEARACIGCGYCAEVCPVDIFPQFTYKAAVVGEMEEALEHGVLDCVECGLCSHVCPSKIDLAQSFKTARADLYQERVRR